MQFMNCGRITTKVLCTNGAPVHHGHGAMFDRSGICDRPAGGPRADVVDVDDIDVDEKHNCMRVSYLRHQ